jgi:ketosteroid isomerase-like protein
MDPPAQLAFFTPDCTFVFANHAPVRGHEAIGAYVQAFFSTIAGLEHELFEVWSVGENVIVRMTVTYTRKDGKRMTFPAAVIWKIRAELISEFRIYVDNSPLFAP